MVAGVSSQVATSTDGRLAREESPGSIGRGDGQRPPAVRPGKVQQKVYRLVVFRKVRVKR